MTIRILTYMALPFILIGTAAQALPPNNLWDASETVQSTLIDALNKKAATFSGENAQGVFKTLILNGSAGVKEVVNLDQLDSLFFGNFNVNNLASSALNSATNSVMNTGIISGVTANDITNFNADNIASKTLGINSQTVMNTDILNGISANDVMNFDVDAYLSMKEGQLKDLTEEQIRNMLGKGISDKISAEQLKALKKDPSQLTSLLGGLANANKQQRQSSNGLVGMGIKKGGAGRIGGTGSSGSSSGTGTTSVLGPDGNRSDAFNGTGNGSTAQFAAAQEQFEDVRGKIEANAQLPKTREELDKITLDQLDKIEMFQEEMSKEMATQGLSKAWIRQEVAKNRQPKREEEAVKMINEGITDVRSAIGVVSLLSIMSVESQNYATDVYSTNLATYGAHLNRRIGTQFMQPLVGSKAGTQATDSSTQK